MMAGLAQRLRAMSRDEVAWRLRTQLRTHSDEAACAVRTPRWNRADVGQALATETLPPELQTAITGGDWGAVHVTLGEVLRGRPSRFVLNPAQTAPLRREIHARWPAADGDALRRATAIARGSFDLLGYRALSFDPTGSGTVDWHFDPVHERRMPMAFWSRVPYLDPAFGDHKVVWELNRHQHWLTLSRALWLTGDSSFADAMVRDLGAWLSANPPLLGANWASMLELAFRSISWSWGLHAMLGRGEGDQSEEPWLVDLMVALDRQLTHVERNLSLYFSPNTHLTGEALALYVVGAAFPELAGSTRWIDTGRAVLLHEIGRQIEVDGGHAERSTHYHRYTLDFYLHALLTARRIGDVEAEEQFRDALHRVVPFALAMADRHGRLPLIGDDDAGRLWPIAGREAVDIRDSLALAAALLDRPEWAPWGLTEEVLWLTTADPEAFARALRMDVEHRRTADRRTLPFRPSVRLAQQPTTHSLLAFPGGGDRRRTTERRGTAPPADSESAPTAADDRVTNVFAATGYVTTATASGDHLVFDVGPHGYLNGGHAHADALAVVLTLRGRPLLVDPGTPTYTMDGTLRDQLRSSLNHNTVTIDGSSSAVPRGPFHWRSRADARLEIARHNAWFAFVDASHDGYGSIGHRRIVVASKGGYLFVDQIVGHGEHEAATHWHFDPGWRVNCEASHALRLVHQSGLAGWLLTERSELSLVTADDTSGLGWVSPAYGIRVPSWTARVMHRDAVPFTRITWCGVGTPGAVPVMERITTSEVSVPTVAVRVRDGEADCVTMLRLSDATNPPLRWSTPEGLETDARLLQCSFGADRLVSMSLADGSYAQAAGQLKIESEGVFSDLHVATTDDRLELTATNPPGALRLEGPLLVNVKRIIGNGRELRELGANHRTVILAASEWPERPSNDLSGSSRCVG
jgi:hypothetical protein